MAGQLKHLGFIVDGNRRWARERHLPTLEGHRRGIGKVEEVIDTLLNTEVEYASFFLFSTENWNRSPEEVAYLMDLAWSSIDKLAKKFHKLNGKMVFFGRPERVDPQLWQKIQSVEELTKDNTGLKICICFNYGGQWEIADAAQKAQQAHETNLTPDTFRNYLYHPEVPDLDMVVRTGGENRISGFMLWRASYAEFLFLQQYFPDITKEDVLDIISTYHERDRRFGK